MDTFQLITSSYSQIEGFATLQGLGSALLGTALATWMLVALYRFLNHGQADFVTPILKIGAAMIVLNTIQPIGDFFASSMHYLSEQMFEKNVSELAASAWTAAFKGVQDPDLVDYVAALFSPVFWICLVTYLQLMGMMVIKLVVIDILWPVMFALVLFSGTVAVPIGVFPGMGTFKGWITNVIEVGIWPLTFQIVTTLLFACFQGQLARMAELDAIWDKVDHLENVAEVHEVIGNDDAAAEVRQEIDKIEVDGVLFTLFKFWAINTAFAFLCIFTPFISRKIVRGESAGFLGGILSAVAMRVGYGMAKTAGGAVGRLAGGLRGRLGGAGTTSPSASEKPREQKLDER